MNNVHSNRFSVPGNFEFSNVSVGPLEGWKLFISTGLVRPISNTESDSYKIKFMQAAQQAKVIHITRRRIVPANRLFDSSSPSIRTQPLKRHIIRKKAIILDENVDHHQNHFSFNKSQKVSIYVNCIDFKCDE
jgi:hypothetical protein